MPGTQDDPRGLKLSEAINEDCRRARVRLAGTVNGTPFELERSAARSGANATSKLRFTLGGEDMSQQVAGDASPPALFC